MIFLIFLICSSYIVTFDLTVADFSRTALGISPSEGQEKDLTLHTSVPIEQKLPAANDPRQALLLYVCRYLFLVVWSS